MILAGVSTYACTCCFINMRFALASIPVIVKTADEYRIDGRRVYEFNEYQKENR